jgi:hypothetical protein
MKLNCKQGDLAIIVSSTCGNEGKIVRCLELLVTDRVPDTKGRVWGYMTGMQAVWRIDRPIDMGNSSGKVTQVMYCADKRLRPLRGDVNDEVLETPQELHTVV